MEWFLRGARPPVRNPWDVYCFTHYSLIFLIPWKSCCVSASLIESNIFHQQTNPLTSSQKHDSARIGMTCSLHLWLQIRWANVRTIHSFIYSFTQSVISKKGIKTPLTRFYKILSLPTYKISFPTTFPFITFQTYWDFLSLGQAKLIPWSIWIVSAVFSLPRSFHGCLFMNIQISTCFSSMTMDLNVICWCFHPLF